MINHKIIISGIVQGIGFRPFVYNLARSLNLGGFIRNDSQGVEIIIQGRPEQLVQFARTLQTTAPIHCRIDKMEVTETQVTEKYTDFTIADSRTAPEKTAQIAPDLDVCPECLREMFNPADRRYLYPFINCTHCGPRFSIVRDVPYDRPMTTMHNFQMCPECQREYDNPADRRFHAQPNACPVCGPRVQLLDQRGREILSGGTASFNRVIFEKVAKLLRVGKIIAVKGLGGFHLACDGRHAEAVATLRRRKYREDKPFAVMFPDLSSVATYCEYNPDEARLLTNTPHPIVLLRKRAGLELAPAIAPGNHDLGCFLPYSPLHHLIMHFFRQPIVLTSGNISDEPIAYENEEALKRLAGIADYYILHDREIHIRCDDSVYRIWNDQPYPLRRSRGFAPSAVTYKSGFIRPVLACGPEQKNTFALAKNDKVYLSQHIGDLVNLEVLQSLEKGITHFRNIFDIEPEIVAHDLHPEYLSTKYALDYPDRTTSEKPVVKIGVQHHHAHAMACLAENNIDEPALAIVLDGTGYGTDGAVWGGEILRVETHCVERLGPFRPALLPGASAAIKNPWQMALSYLSAAYGEELGHLRLPFLKEIPPGQVEIVMNMLRTGFNSPVTTSCGRLFDGVAALVGLRNSVNYEGQAAVEFEQCIENNNGTSYDFFMDIRENGFVIDWRPMIRQVVEDLNNRAARGSVALKFHNGLAHILLQAALKARQITGLNIIALSGGVFMNIYLLARLSALLEAQKFKVCTHHQTPCNDGDIAFGQAVIANAIYQYQNKAGKYECA